MLKDHQHHSLLCRKARGLRLQSIRKSLQLTRQEFAQKLGVSDFTIQNWEINKNNGLPENRIPQLIEMLKTLGVHCTREWLLEGTGFGPMIVDPAKNDFTEMSCSVQNVLTYQAGIEASLILQEKQLFQDHYRGCAIVFVVPDENMLPRYTKGEYVAGVKYYADNINLALEKDCIVQIKSGELLLRHVRKGSQDQLYHLLSSNHAPEISQPFIYDIKITMAAPVVWSRKPVVYPSLKQGVK